MEEGGNPDWAGLVEQRPPRLGWGTRATPCALLGEGRGLPSPGWACPGGLYMGLGLSPYNGGEGPGWAGPLWEGGLSLHGAAGPWCQVTQWAGCPWRSTGALCPLWPCRGQWGASF